MAGIFSFLRIQKSSGSSPLFEKKHFDEKIGKKYDMQEMLGTGGFSEVRVGREKSTGKKYAIKCISKRNLKRMKEAMVNVESEVSILRKIKHQYVVGMVELIDNKDSLYLVMDLVTGGELFDRIVARGSYTERDASEIVKQILIAMSYIHSIGIVHRDLKPENLLYQSRDGDAHIMVTDFGLARMVKDIGGEVTACGTPGYIAPEVLYLKPYGVAVDCWAIGVITYILLCGYPPFYDERDEVVYHQIMKGDYEFDQPYWDDISSQATDFVSNLMELDAKRRLTCDEALRHPWICDNVSSSKDIHNSVSEQIKKYRVCSKWKKVVNARNFVERLRKSQINGEINDSEKT